MGREIGEKCNIADIFRYDFSIFFSWLQAAQICPHFLISTAKLRLFTQTADKKINIFIQTSHAFQVQKPLAHTWQNVR